MLSWLNRSSCTRVAPINWRNWQRQLSMQPQEARPSTPLSSDPSKTTHYRVTLFRSPIGLPKRRKDCLASLGLWKRMDVSYHRHSPDAAGLILRVKELLKVENVTDAEVQFGRNSSRRLIGDDRGYRLLKNVLDR
ncbi:hypothetical protein O181_036109 [Austropuccinia psidii MF-1]|uniref:Large ribosomal subunit protein uL30m n=1 Tax=Austropuccinia psidii MF-1 TaxID=1389203 RepID=A0A9Q3D411_9BASI|nr:hypothetical protein [Austropuccinia psidii MF-1]